MLVIVDKKDGEALFSLKPLSARKSIDKNFHNSAATNAMALDGDLDTVCSEAPASAFLFLPGDFTATFFFAIVNKMDWKVRV